MLSSRLCVRSAACAHLDDLGFECGMVAGSTASLAVLGARDLILIALAEFPHTTRNSTSRNG